jgi:hypothetical protein
MISLGCVQIVIAFDLLFIVQHYILYNKPKDQGPIYYPLNSGDVEAKGDESKGSVDVDV